MNIDFNKELNMSLIIKPIFDKIQTHAVYFLHVENVYFVMLKLHELGATNFKILMTTKTYRILKFTI